MPGPSAPTETSGPGTSPTPTVRNVLSSMPRTMPPSTSEAGPGPSSILLSSGAGPVTAGEGRRTSDSRIPEQLGKGRPGPDHLSAPRSPLQRSLSPSAYSEYDYYTDDDAGSPFVRRSRTPGPRPGMNTGEYTPRLGAGPGGSQRGPPAATGSAFGSPQTQFSNGGSAHRSARLPRNNSTSGHPMTYPVNPNASSHPYGALGVTGGTASRSTSRARPPLSTQNTAFGLGLGIGPGRSAQTVAQDEDDEAPIVDRGEDLIRRRQRERKQARKNEERKRRRAGAGESTDPSAPPSGVPEESFLQQQQRSLGPAAGRSVSRTRATSATRVKKEPSEGYFASYDGSATGNETPTPRDDLLSPRAAFRPASIYSSTADDDEEEEREREVMEDVIADVVDEAAEQEEQEAADDDESGEADEGASEEGVTLRDRQDAINIEHPFGLPIWKPALYRKSRSVTRNAENALHNIPSAAAERHLLPGNIGWVLVFGWWLAIVCFGVAMAVSGVEALGGGRGGYGKTLRGLAWYIGWPFGKYVEGEGAPEEDAEHHDEEGSGVDEGQNGYGGVADSPAHRRREPSDGAASNLTVRQHRQSTSNNMTDGLPDEPRAASRRETTVSFANTISTHSKRGSYDEERAPLLSAGPGKKGCRRPRNRRAKLLGRVIYWPLFLLVLAPIMLLTTTICWFCVFTIPMAKLNWRLLGLLFHRPLEINFRSAPKVHIPLSPSTDAGGDADGDGDGGESGSTTLNESPSGMAVRYRRAHLKAGQVAPTSGPTSTVLLCTYRAIGVQYYKYTVGGVNILFINLIPLVFFTIFDAFVLLPAVERDHAAGRHPSPFLSFIASQALIFVLSLSSVIPLSYFIGMAVASISAQSSIGMGAVINATFGSIIEIILYAIALIQGKGRLVEGSIVGSILAGVLLMPGASMCSGAFKRKEQKFNAKSAGVTSTMLIMAIIGTLTPTMFYQTYGTFELHCDGCPPMTNDDSTLTAQDAWNCQRCHYEHPDPASDPFYQDQVKTLMYCCAGILLFSYLIGLWFSLRTHASQIWQNPQQLLKPDDAIAAIHPAVKASLSQRITPQTMLQQVLPLHHASARDKGASQGTVPITPTQTAFAAGSITEGSGRTPLQGTVKLPKVKEEATSGSDTATETDSTSGAGSRSTSAAYNLPEGYTPFLDGLNQLHKPSPASAHPERLPPMRLPSSLTTEDFTRAVAVATVSALRHQRSFAHSMAGSGTQGSGRKERPTLVLGGNRKGDDVPTEGLASVLGGGADYTGGLAMSAEHAVGDSHQGAAGDHGDGGGGHEAPEWTRTVSAAVLLSCTLLYAVIAEILVDVVDVVLENIKIDEKFLGLTLFTLIPNVTEFMNAMSFALNGNIALSMEIGSAYALQVCLLQIPAMVAFSAFYDPGKMGEMVDTFTLIFPRWDVIAIILSIFLLTYTYIEARANYHRGSILVLAYIVLVMGFYYAPSRDGTIGSDGDLAGPGEAGELVGGVHGLVGGVVQAGWRVGLTKLWA